MNAGSPGGLSLASASIVCKGPNTLVPITGSAALASYASTFQGVAFQQDNDPDGEAVALLSNDLHLLCLKALLSTSLLCIDVCCLL